MFDFGLVEHTPGAGATKVHTPGLSQYDTASGVHRYFHEDWLGSTRYLSDGAGNAATGMRFDAYGQKSNSLGDSPRATDAQYAGYEREQDETGLDYLYQRFYDPAVGRFISRDGIGWAGGLNLYGYCGGDPANATDPSGNSPAFIVAGGIGGVTGALSASDEYVNSAGDNYTWYGHLWANTKGAGNGIIQAFNPVNIWHGLHDSVQQWGCMEGMNDSGHASPGQLWLARGNAALNGAAAVSIASGSVRGVTQLRRFVASAWLQRLTTQANRDLIANPTLARTVLHPAELAAGERYKSVAAANYGKAIERMVAERVDTKLGKYFFEYTSRPFKSVPDFRGWGLFKGLNFDISTESGATMKGGRSYGNGLITPTYSRPK